MPLADAFVLHKICSRSVFDDVYMITDIDVWKHIHQSKIKIFTKIEFFRSFSLKNNDYVYMPLCFLKNVGGKLGKAAQELSGIVGTLNLSQRAFLCK